MEFKKKITRTTNNHDRKIYDLKNAMKDDLFLSDLKEISEDFKDVDVKDRFHN